MTIAPVERAGRNDLLQLSYQSRPAASQVGAVLIVGPGQELDLDTVRRTVGERVRAVPRLRQQLAATPLGCGRPVWVDDPAFDIAGHVDETWCPGPGDDRALLDLAASLVAARLPADRPLWAATLVRGLVGGRTGLVVRFHHVLADGVGGLAVLAQLVDNGSPPAAVPFPRPMPSRRRLAAEAARSRLAALRRLPPSSRSLISAFLQLRAGLLTRAPRTSLNRPTGTSRRLALAHTDLASVRAAAHASGGTVNDVVLAAITGAAHAFLLGRGENQDRFVVAVFVSGHLAGERSPVRNQSGVVPVPLPAGGDRWQRLREVTRRTKAVKATARGATAILVEPAFALLARLRLVRWSMNHQRRVNIFATNLRGPSERLAFVGAPVIALLPLNAVAGNVAVAFGTLSYAGTLAVTVVADPEVCPDVEGLAAELQRELDGYAGTGSSLPPTRLPGQGTPSAHP
jgi:diacylglycerol O-acyltransferase / wax synthase